MRIFNYCRPSSLLILLLSIILVLGLSLAYIIRIVIDDLNNEASMINNAGLVRGSMQQLVKLTLAEPNKHHAIKIAEINYLLRQVSVDIRSEQLADDDSGLIESVTKLEHDWQLLIQRLETYRDQGGEALHAEILTMSESIWDQANDVVYLLQRTTEKKVESISRVFYLLIVLNVVSAITVIVIILLAVRNYLEYETSHDALTSLLNRRAYDLAMSSELARNARYDLPVSLILFDIDHFKQINDQHGHRAGDVVLKRIAGLVMNSVRQIDSVYRVGGEEFAIICPETVLEGAHQLAEKIRHEVLQAEFNEVGHLSISLGVAQYDKNISAIEFYQNADKALYLAKNNGRNRSEVYR